jgi:hypothetical protein
MFALVRIVYICLVAFCGSGVFAKTQQVRALQGRTTSLARSLILDNLTMAIIAAEDVRGCHPLFALKSVSAIAVAAVDPTQSKVIER